MKRMQANRLPVREMGLWCKDEGGGDEEEMQRGSSRSRICSGGSTSTDRSSFYA